MTEPIKTKYNHNLRAKTISEGYCCVWGFLALCRARNQSPASMMQHLGLSRLTFYYHDRKAQKGGYSCENRADCLKPVIGEITGETK